MQEQEAEAALRAPVHLACVEGPDIGTVIALEAPVVLGRGAPVDLEAPGASRRHARVSPVPAARARVRGRADRMASVEDLGSANGTAVRARRRRWWGHGRWKPLRRPDGRPAGNGPAADAAQTTGAAQTAGAAQTVGAREREGGPGRNGVLVGIGDRIRVGEDVFELRARPEELGWPEPAVPTRRVGGMAGIGAVSLVAMPVFLVWRLVSWTSGTVRAAVLVASALVVAVAAAVAMARRVRRARSWAQWDAGHLAVVLASMRAGPGVGDTGVGDAGPRAGPPHWTGPRTHGTARTMGSAAGAWPPPAAAAATTAVWPERVGPGGAVHTVIGTAPSPGPPGRRSRLDRPDPRGPAPGRDAATARPGFVGPGARQAARWWVAQVAARTGGATVLGDGPVPVVLGDGRTPVHISRLTDCAACREGTVPAWPVVHIGVASSFADLPTWCDLVMRPAAGVCSPRWWAQIATAAPDGAAAALPDLVEFEPAVAGAHTGTDGGAGSDGLGVVLGRDARGAVLVDLVTDGPHALVAGTTGSGKSEALATWLLGMCDAVAPEDLRLVLVDYKGGAAFAPLAALPHTEVVLTDLDPGATDRAIRGLAALLRARERQMAGQRVPDLARWRSAHRRGLAPAPPPRIVIAVDEFRVLADSHPHTLDALVRLAAQGRSLGLHLLVATQRPAGAVSPAMRANIEVRLALRCADAADSLDVIGTTHAAELARVPGRAVLRGHGELQVAWVRDVPAQVRHISRRWGEDGRAAERPRLWPAPLPRVLTWEDLEAVPAGASSATGPVDGTWTGPSIGSVAGIGPVGGIGTGPAIGLVDGIDAGAHAQLVWTGGHVRLEGPHLAAGSLGQAALAIGSRLAQHLGVPLHACADCARPPGPWTTWTGPSDPGTLAHLVEQVCSHGPSVVVATDVGAIVQSLDRAIGAGAGRSLWEAMVRGADRAGVVLVAADPGTFGSSSGVGSAFGLRLVALTGPEDALRAGLPARTPASSLPGRLVVVGGADAPTLTCQVPLAPARGHGPGRDGSLAPGHGTDLGHNTGHGHDRSTDLDRTTGHGHGRAQAIHGPAAEAWTVRPLPRRGDGPLGDRRPGDDRTDTGRTSCTGCTGSDHADSHRSDCSARTGSDRSDRTVSSRSDCGGDAAPHVLVGARLRALDADPRTPWVVVGRDPAEGVRALDRLRAPGCAPIVVLSAQEWMRLRQFPDHAVLALEPDPDLLRFLASTARHAPLALRAERWGPGTGVVLVEGVLTRATLGERAPSERPGGDSR